MKQLFTLLICSIVGGLSAQSADWNPDANGDGLVGSSDLLALLTAYGESFAPPSAEDNWIECTEEHYTVISDTIFPSEWEDYGEEAFLSCSAYEDFVESQSSLNFFQWADSIFVAGGSVWPLGAIKTYITWSNTCNSIDHCLVLGQAGVTSGLLTPPEYPEGARLRFLYRYESWIPLWFSDIGEDLVNTDYVSNCADISPSSTIEHTLISNSKGWMGVAPNCYDVVYTQEGVYQGGLWFYR